MERSEELREAYGVSAGDARLAARWWKSRGGPEGNRRTLRSRVLGTLMERSASRYGPSDPLFRYVTEQFLGIPVGKYSYGYRQFWPSWEALESVGAFCSFGPNITLTGINHPMSWVTTSPILFFASRGFVPHNVPAALEEGRSGRVAIGNDVWIGANVTILPGVRIEDGAVVGAGSVVTSDVPAYAVVAGVPAKTLRYRFAPEVIEGVRSSRWWEWDDERIRAEVATMRDPAAFAVRFGGGS